MEDGEVGYEKLVLRPTWTPARHTDQLRPLRREGIESFTSPIATYEKPAQNSCANEGEQSRIDSRDRRESGGDHELLTIRDMHDP
jgi:hypothetical protein